MNHTKKKNAPLIIILVAFAIIVMIGTVFYNSRKSGQAIAAGYDIPKSVKIDGTIFPKARPIQPFQLTDNKGQPFTEKDFKGHWNLVFFGFTNCAYVCPTTLAALNIMYNKLEKDLPKDQLPRVTFVSVDPDRDSVARVNQYVTSFNKNFHGARGSMQQTKNLASQMAASFQKIQRDGGDKSQYTINHSTAIVLVDPLGNIRGLFSFPHTGPQMARDYENILRSEHQHAYM